MSDRWIFAIVLSIILGLLALVSTLCLYAEASKVQDTHRAEARIAACRALPTTDQVILCLKDAG